MQKKITVKNQMEETQKLKKCKEDKLEMYLLKEAIWASAKKMEKFNKMQNKMEEFENLSNNKKMNKILNKKSKMWIFNKVKKRNILAKKTNEKI